MTQLFKVLVGSQAHGLAGTGSDFDYRGVFANTTRDILRLDSTAKTTQWIEGDEDNTAWELGKFLHLATKCNPTILEAFLAPVVEGGPYTDAIRALFKHVWNSRDVINAFTGYGLNQRKKLLDFKDARGPKYACAYLRTLFNAHQLLTTGTFSVDLVGTPVFDDCRRYKAGGVKTGEVIQTCLEWQSKVQDAYNTNPEKKTDLEPVNELLLKIRKDLW